MKQHEVGNSENLEVDHLEVLINRIAKYRKQPSSRRDPISVLKHYSDSGLEVTATRNGGDGGKGVGVGAAVGIGGANTGIAAFLRRAKL